MTYPGATTYPGSTTYPGGSAPTPIVPVVDTPAAVSLNGMVLNAVDEFGVEWWCGQIDGWDGSPASSLQVTQKSRGAGGWTGPRNLTPRSLGPMGTFIAPDIDTAEDAKDRLNAACNLNGVTLSVQRGTRVQTCTVYRQGEVQVTEGRGSLQYTWVLNLIAPDPRKFGDTLTAATGLPSTTGGFTFPHTFPMTIASTIASGRCVLNNPGTATGPVVLRIDGPVVGPQIVHVGSGLTLTFASSLSIPTGQFLEVDMEAQTALANGQPEASRNNSIVARGWSGFSPGANEWDFSAVSGTGQLTVNATESWQ